jgi:phosphoserine phosphatase RsbU/P
MTLQQVPEASFELQTPHNVNSLRHASLWLKQHGSKHDIPAEKLDFLDVFLNEGLANVLDHGGPVALASPIRLDFSYKRMPDVNEASLTIIDAGAPFNPLTFPRKPRPQTLEDAEPGGLGIQIMRDLADDLSYRHQDGHNLLTFTVHWEVHSDPGKKMNLNAHRFSDGPDRRAENIQIKNNRRVSKYERRIRGLEWLLLFRGTDKTAVMEIIQDCKVLELPAGTPLLKPGESNASVYILLSGDLAAFLDSDLNPHASIPIALGECIGEISAIDGKPVTALVVAISDARVMMLTPDLFLNKVMTIPGVGRNLLISLTERMRRTNHSMLESQRKQLELEHLHKELDVARQLQASMLPLRRPMFPDHQEIDVSALMEPASEVGGDLFEAFFVDARHLFICIGDVSGHGIPAALFMARSIGLMHIAAMSTLDPAALIGKINEQLCTGNETNLFITLFCGFLDVSTGHLQYSNGGHCAPIVLSNGKASRLPIPKGTLVGAISGLSYTSNKIVLDTGDTLVCFTDGVTEAQASSGEEFSEERLIKLLQKSADQPLEGMLDTIRGEIMSFSGNSSPDDDFTLLLVRRKA